MSTTSLRLLGVLALAVFAACGGEQETEADPQPRPEISAAPAPTLADAAGIGLRNAVSPMEGMVSAGQPTEEQFAALVEAGYVHFISLRPESEDGAGWEEVYASEHEHDFARLPISGAASLTRENVDAFAALLAEVGDEPTVIYCASGNRVGAMLALKAFWLDGVSAEDALQLGLDAGMTRLTDPVTELLGLEGGN